LTRISRIAESHYNTGKNRDEKDTFVGVEGASHFSFCTGKMPSNVASNDLMAEISESDAHVAFAQRINAWILKKVIGNSIHLQKFKNEADLLLKPVTEAYLSEGSRHFNAPNQVGGPLSSTCVKGTCLDQTPKAITAQKHIAGD